MNKVIDKGFRSCRFVSTIVKHPVYMLVFYQYNHVNAIKRMLFLLPPHIYLRVLPTFLVTAMYVQVYSLACGNENFIQHNFIIDMSAW